MPNSPNLEASLPLKHLVRYIYFPVSKCIHSRFQANEHKTLHKEKDAFFTNMLMRFLKEINVMNKMVFDTTET